MNPLLNNLTLYHYWRSSSSWRVRLALEYKKIKPAKLVHVGLLNGESESPEHQQRNPMGYVPVVETSNGKTLLESVAIIEWLEELQPEPPLFPGDAFDRQHIRALCELINAGIQPLQNLTTMDRHSSDETQRKEWCQFFMRKGLKAYETIAAPRAGTFSVGNKITAADFFLIPQCYTSLRFEIDLEREFPLIARIYTHALKLPEVQRSEPKNYEPR